MVQSIYHVLQGRQRKHAIATTEEIMKPQRFCTYTLCNNSVDYVLKRIEDLIRRNSNGRISKLRSPQREALKRIIEELKENKQVRGVVQLPTGTGKSVVMASTIAALKELGLVDKGVIIVLAPLNRIKHQLFNTFKECLVGARNTSRPDFVVAAVSSSNKQSEIEVKMSPERVETSEDFVIKANLKHWFNTVHKTARSIVSYLQDEYPLVLLLSHEAFSRLINCLTHSSVDLKGLIIDEVHYKVRYDSKIGEAVRKLMNAKKDTLKVVLGFTATPTRSSLQLFSSDRPLYGVSSIDLMINVNNEIILVPQLRLYAYQTKIIKTPPGIKLRGDEQWRYAIKERAEKIAETIVEFVDKKGLVEKLGRFPKTLILAANTREASLIAEKLRKLIKERSKSDGRWSAEILEAHTNTKDPHRNIERFASDDGRKATWPAILVAVDMVKLGYDDPNLELLVIARRMRSPIAYVQARGRVLRWPTDVKGNLKAKERYAIILHLDYRDHLEREEVIRRVEEGKEDITDYKELEGYNGEVKEIKGVKVKITPINEDQPIISPPIPGTPKTKDSLIREHQRASSIASMDSVCSAYRIEKLLRVALINGSSSSSVSSSGKAVLDTL